MAAKKKKRACGGRGKFKSGPRKGRCKPKSSSGVIRAGSKGRFCIKTRGAPCAKRCFKSAAAAMAAAKKIENGIVGGEPCRVWKKKQRIAEKKAKAAARREQAKALAAAKKAAKKAGGFHTLRKQLGR